MKLATETDAATDLPPSRHRRRRALAIIILAGLLLAGGYYLTLPMRFGHQLRTVCADADRVVVDCNTWPGPKPLQDEPVLPSYEIRGQEQAAALLQSFKLKAHSPAFVLPIECKCDGDLVFRFYRGDRQLAAVSYKHQKNLRWVASNWRGDVPLAPEGREATEAWIARNTGRSFAEIRHETSQRWAQWDDEQEKKLQKAGSQPSTTQPA